MNKKRILIKFLLIIGISSCQKNSVEYPITYSSYLISESNIKVYTKDGEVISPTIVNNIVKRYQSYIHKLESDKIGGKIIANYLSKDSVELTIDNINEVKLRSVHEISGIIFWQKQDTSMFGYSPIFKVEDIYKYHPIYYYEFNAPAGSAYSKYVKFKECYYVIKNGGKLNIPMFDFLRIYNDKVAESISGINNSFSEVGLSNLFPSDTIIIQNYLIEMK